MSKLRFDTQMFGKKITLGGVDVLLPGWGDIGAGEVLLRKNDAGALSPLLTIEAVNATDVVGSIAGSIDILGRIDASGGQLKVPQGTTFPVSGEEGDLFWKSDTDELYIYNGASWQLLTEFISAVENLSLSGSEVSSSNTGFVEIMKFQANLKSLFPFNSFKLQANAWASGSATGEIRLYNFTDAAIVANAIISVSGSTPTLYEAASASTPIDALKEYTLDFKRIGGIPVNVIAIRGAMLRKV